MARKPSVILTPTEKKQAVAAAKEGLKTARVLVNDLEKTQKAAEKEHAARLKELTKAFELGNKERTKSMKDALKSLESIEASYAKLTAAPPVPNTPVSAAVPTPTA